MDISVVIPTRDRAPLLRLTLSMLVRQALATDRWELIVVDDGSRDDETAAILADITRVSASYLRQEPQGASAARNAAIAMARGRVLVFLDDDAFVGPHFLSEHLALHAASRPTLVAGGIVQVREIPSRIDEAPGLPAYHRHPMPGGNSSVLTSAVRDAGGFDPWFSSYGWQDQELAQRLLANGLQRRFAWRAPIY
ncbi:MAG: glycosyltransferase family A protein, partial [Gemmatimonadaceae bacterium]